jgi:hypothetical protein
VEVSTCGIKHPELTYPFVALGKSDLTSVDNNLPSSVVSSNAGDQLDVLDERGAGKADDLANVSLVCHANRDSGAADIFDGIGNEFRDENVVVRTVAN